VVLDDLRIEVFVAVLVIVANAMYVSTSKK
jgi:hypothetical protein